MGVELLAVGGGVVVGVEVAAAPEAASDAASESVVAGGLGGCGVRVAAGSVVALEAGTCVGWTFAAGTFGGDWVGAGGVVAAPVQPNTAIPATTAPSRPNVGSS